MLRIQLLSYVFDASMAVVNNHHIALYSVYTYMYIHACRDTYRGGEGIALILTSLCKHCVARSQIKRNNHNMCYGQLLVEALPTPCVSCKMQNMTMYASNLTVVPCGK